MSLANIGPGWGVGGTPTTLPPFGLPGLFVCECGWHYQQHGRKLYCTGIVNDRLCGKRLTCVVEPIPPAGVPEGDKKK
jgi:hypothetical protein